MDNDGISDTRLPIQVKITVTQDPEASITFDFNGTADQAVGGINMVWQALMATVFYAVKAVFSPHVPTNAGFQRPIHIHASRGSLVNACEPAPVGGRTDTCQRVVDAIMGALSQIVPHRVIAASNGATTAIIFSGIRLLSDEQFVYIEALGGGMGARINKDGMDGIQVHITNTSNLPIEAMELEYPLRVQQYSLVPDTGGTGKYRGGLAIRKEIQALSPVIFSAHADRHHISPWGLQGGKSGSRGQFLHINKDGVEEVIPSKISGIKFQPGEVLIAQTAGGGGFGSPLERDPSKVAYDFIQGKISLRESQQAYGVLLTEDGEIDSQNTNKLRDRLRNASSN
jgi:N-methylhydantoinase B